MSVTVKALHHDRRTIAAYLDLIRRVHADDPHWIAPLRRATKSALIPIHSSFHRAGNHYRAFALQRGAALVGHVLATVNVSHRDGDRTVGALGFLEVEPEYADFERLLDAALAWLHERGVDRVWATMNFDIWHGYRVMTRGFDKPAFFGEPRNTPWLPEYLERYGFVVRKRWLSVTQDQRFLDARAPFFEPRYAQALADGFRFEPLQPADGSQMRELHAAINTTFSHFDAYTPIAAEEFDALVRRFLRFTGTELATGLRDAAGAFAGFSIAFADPSMAMRRLDGNDGWLGRLRLLRKPSPDRALYYMVGVTPEVRTKQKGLGSALLYHTLQRVRAHGYPLTTFALLAEDSPARHFAMDQVAAPEREYALYQLDR